jgi:hypothetical protein
MRARHRGGKSDLVDIQSNQKRSQFVSNTKSSLVRNVCISNRAKHAIWYRHGRTRLAMAEGADVTAAMHACGTVNINTSLCNPIVIRPARDAFQRRLRRGQE